MPVYMYSEVCVEKVYVVCWPMQWGCWVETAQSRCGLTVQLYNLSHKYTPAHIHFELKIKVRVFKESTFLSWGTGLSRHQGPTGRFFFQYRRVWVRYWKVRRVRV